MEFSLTNPFGKPEALGAAYEAVFLTPDRTRSSVIPLAYATVTHSGSLNGLDFVGRETIFFIRRSLDGSKSDVTSRVRLGQLDMLRRLDFEALVSVPADEGAVTSLSSLVETARWIQISTIERHFSGILGHVSRDLSKAHSDADQSLVAHLLAKLDRRMGGHSAMVDVLNYVYILLRLKALSGAPYPDSGELTGAARDLAMSVLEDSQGIEGCPLTNSLRVALFDAVGLRQEAVSASERIRDGFSSVDVGAESGVLSYGVPVHTSDLEPPSWEKVDVIGELNPAKTSIVIGADSRFWAAYGARSLFYAHAMPEFDFVFLVIDDEDVQPEVTRNIVEYWKALQKLRRSAGPAISIVASAVPSWAVNRAAYFASARFFYVRDHLADHEQGLWTQDIDLYPTADYSRALPALKDCDVALVRSTFVGGVIPWKRYLAGNIHFNWTNAAVGFVDNLTSHLIYWLSVGGAWMADQTALSYAVSCSDVLRILDMRDLRVPLTQSVLNSKVERTANLYP